MIWLAASVAMGVAGFAVLAWHMRQPDWRKVRFSGLKFLPELAPTPRKLRRWRWRLPARSLAFWLRMVLIAALAWSLWDNRDYWHDLEEISAVGVRIVVDGSASMTVGAPSRFVTAKAEVERVLDLALSNAGEGAFCSEVWIAGRLIINHGESWPNSFRPDPSDTIAMRPARLVAIAESRPTARCGISDVVIISDAPKPSGAPDNIVWRMIGDPVTNVAITNAILVRPGLLTETTELRLRVEAFGTGISRTTVQINGPDSFSVVKEVDFTGLPPFEITATLAAAGRYQASLGRGGGLTIDDRVEIDVALVARTPLDWRLLEPPAPYDVPGDDWVVVSQLDALTPADMAGSFVGLAAPWRGAATEIGVFVEDAPLLADVNLDAFSQYGPAPLPEPMPDGFVPVIARAHDGRAFAAVRAFPRAALVPDPGGAADPESRKLALTLFYNALDWVLAPSSEPLTVTWVQPNGARWSNAPLESDTGRSLGPGDPLAFGLRESPQSNDQDEGNLWPWLVLLAALCMAAERGLSASTAWRQSGADT